MTARVGEIVLPNPVMTASGTSGHGAELASYFDLSSIGAVVVKSLLVDAWPGNPPPRLLPLPAGMMNSVGLQGPGLLAWLAHDLPQLRAMGARVVASVWGRTAEEFAAAGQVLAGTLVSEAGAAVRPGGLAGTVVAVEANISCPNVEDRQRMFAHSESATTAATGALVASLAGTGLPVWAKLSPNVTDITAIAGAALGAGATGLTLVNTLMGLALDPATGRPRLGGGGGGVSGPALHPVAVRAVRECRLAFPSTPIVGVGGVVTGEDAAEILAAGADAVQVGTASFADPRAPARVLAELEQWCVAHRFSAVACLRELAKP